MRKLCGPAGIIRVWETEWGLSEFAIQSWTTQLSPKGKIKEHRRETNRIYLLGYSNVFHLESTSFAALIQLFCTAEMVLFAAVFSGAGITRETDHEPCAYSLYPISYMGRGSHLSVTPMLLASVCQVFRHVSVSVISTWPLYLKQSSVGLFVVLASPFGLSLLQRKLLLV